MVFARVKFTHSKAKMDAGVRRLNTEVGWVWDGWTSVEERTKWYVITTSSMLGSDRVQELQTYTEVGWVWDGWTSVEEWGQSDMSFSFLMCWVSETGFRSWLTYTEVGWVRDGWRMDAGVWGRTTKSSYWSTERLLCRCNETSCLH